MITVTKPFLPPRQDYEQLLDQIWKRNWLTNNGPVLNELELALKRYLDLEHLLFVSNGTIAIQLAIKALDLQGEIITTPFSYVATTSSISWENCKPVFVDIDPLTLNIDPAGIEARITNKTSAILATHVFGIPCDIEAIQAIADKHDLKVIYDAAHCFGTEYKGRSILEYGDVSTLSLHATKLYHSVEGGLVVTKDPEILRRLAYMRNFGHNGPEAFFGLGINGKNSEFHAAMGLTNLNYADDILFKRKAQHQLYKEILEPLEVSYPKHEQKGVKYNYAYFPVLYANEQELLEAMEALRLQYISARRYFYPALNSLEYVEKQACPIAEDVSKRIMCLPLYHSLTEADITMICRVLIRQQRYAQRQAIVQ